MIPLVTPKERNLSRLWDSSEKDCMRMYVLGMLLYEATSVSDWEQSITCDGNYNVNPIC